MLTLSKTHDATLTIDDEPIQFRVKRMTKGEGIAFQRDFYKHGQPRGDREMTEQEEAASRQFIEESISAYVSLDAGQIRDEGRDVVTGDDVIRAFCTRADVLTAVYGLIYTENFCGKAQKKIWSTLPHSSPGSAPSTKPSDGARPAPIAGNAESSSSALPEPATALSA